MTSRSRVRLFAPGLLAAVSILTIGSALADSYYFRTRGVIANPDRPSTAGLSIQNVNVRAGSSIEGSLETSIRHAEWVISQTPEMPSLNLEVSSDGVSGAAPNVLQSMIFTVNAQASNGKKSAAANPVAVTIYPKVSISGGPPKEILARVGTSIPSYSNYAVSGIVNTATYELLSDDTPVNISTICPGLTFSDKTGMISGTPTALCVKALAVRVTDAFDGSSATSAPFSIVAPLALAGTPDRFIYNEPYSFDLSRLTSGGKKPYTYKLTSGSLPHGLTLTSSGKVSGTPTMYAAASSPTIAVTDNNGQTSSTPVSFKFATSNAFSWGRNDFGQLGDGTKTDSAQAISIVGGKSYIQLAAGQFHSCGLVNDGTVQCWGDNRGLQLGVEGIESSRVPITVPGIAGASSITVGSWLSCAIVSGAVKCWGYGQLGDGSTTRSSAPVQVSALPSDVTAISTSGFHTCAIVSGAAKCWGYNNHGQLGDGSKTNSAVPVQVIGLEANVTAIATANGHTCAIISGAAKCWGRNSYQSDDYGQLGNSSNKDSSIPVQVTGLTSGVTAISTSGFHTCAIVSGAAKCWGSNGSNQLGSNYANRSLSYPVQVRDMTAGVEKISAGLNQTCVIVSGITKCWGWNGVDNFNVSYPTQVKGLPSEITEIFAGGYHVFAR